MVGLLTTDLFPLLVLLAISAPVAIPFFFGPHWGDAVVPVQILAWGARPRSSPTPPAPC